MKESARISGEDAIRQLEEVRVEYAQCRMQEHMQEQFLFGASRLRRMREPSVITLAHWPYRPR